ncbi:hypothetical protein N7G274_001668 [Stereocaulon virgatum]|uniref:Uncharacterized protein n=1 Tax=Stereocaulon virgatum TaxID=373712 RepID=A0ABR4AN18_9LECA
MVDTTPWSYDSHLMSYLNILIRGLFALIILAFPFMLPHIFSYFFIPPGYDGVSNEEYWLQEAIKNRINQIETLHGSSTAQTHQAEGAMRLEGPHGSLWGPDPAGRILTRDSEPDLSTFCPTLATAFGTCYTDPLSVPFTYSQIAASSSPGGSYVITYTILVMIVGSSVHTRVMQRP